MRLRQVRIQCERAFGCLLLRNDAGTRVKNIPGDTLPVIVGKTRPGQGVIGLEIDRLLEPGSRLLHVGAEPKIVAVQVGIMSCRIYIAVGLDTGTARCSWFAMALAASSGSARSFASRS